MISYNYKFLIVIAWDKDPKDTSNSNKNLKEWRISRNDLSLDSLHINDYQVSVLNTG